jgi:2-hydroxy-3-oxopropionate reductase
MSKEKLPQIGFVGLGLMGSAMVSRLMSCGYDVTIMGRNNRAPIDAAVANGATEAKSCAELTANADIIMLCMDTSASVESRMYGEAGIIQSVKKGTIVIDFGTSLPESTQRIGEAMNEVGAHYMDAPLGRTPVHAKDGLLNIMAAGSDENFATVEPVLKVLGENVYYIGELGTGHTLKLINNFFGMTLATTMSEAFAVADKAGISRQRLYDVMSAGPLHSPMMDFVKGNAVDGNKKSLGFTIGNAHKDLSYFSSMTHTLKAPSFIGPATTQALTLATLHGLGGEDVPVMVDYFAEVFAETAAK